MTQDMRNNFSRFGDVVSFELTECVVSDNIQNSRPYQLALFTVFDSNCRILITAIALHRTDSVADLYQVFKGFFKLATKRPSAIITSLHPSTTRTMDILREIEVYKGLHLLDRESVMQDIGSNFEHDQKIRKEMINLAKKVIEEGNYEHALISLDEMCRLVPDENGDRTLLHFLEMKDKICLWSLPAIFVGTNFSSSKQIKMLVTERIGTNLQLTDMVKQIIEVDKILCVESAGPGCFYKEATEDLFRDQHIKLVRNNIEQNIFKLFIKCYILSIKEDNLYGKSTCEDTNAEVTHVQNRLTGNIFEVKNGKCSCQMSIKTGVPCQHMITTAKANNFGYLNMFANRWRKTSNAASTIPAVSNGISSGKKSK